jgi:tetratricopeptide (TPR) repeat protein
MNKMQRKVGKARKGPVFRIWPVIGLVVLGITAYANSFGGPFIFDDEESVVENPYIVRLWPADWMYAPPQSTVAGRPVASLSLAVNYAISGYSVWSYHLFNLAVHILAGLALYGIVRRTLLCERLRERFSKHSAVLAWIAAAIWVVHPIQTESVTYIVQRMESLMGLFYLLTLYSAIRAMEPGGGLLWPAVSVVCCGLGMGTKEAMVTAPVLVLLYDRAFFAGSFIAAFRRRWGLYVGLAATWLILAALLWSGPRQEQSSGFSISGSLSYAINQGVVIMRYLRLVVWPRGLCLDYSWAKQEDWGKLVLPAATVLGTLAAAVWGLVRNKVWSYPAAWFFWTLAVTSSFVPVKDLIFEHRMYLPLAGLTVLAVAGVYVLLERWSVKRAGIILAAAVICVLGLVTLQRNSDYRSAASIWQNVLDVIPDNSRAHNNLGVALKSAGRVDDAIRHYNEALRVTPDDEKTLNNLGVAFQAMGRYDEAINCFNRALQAKPKYVDTYYNLGWIFELQGKFDEAIDYYRRALQINPGHPKAHNNLGKLLSQQGKVNEAMEHFRIALELKPEYADAHYNIGCVLQSQGRVEEAISHYYEALRITPNDADAHTNLGIALAATGRVDEAIEHYKKALEIDPNHTSAKRMLDAMLKK